MYTYKVKFGIVSSISLVRLPSKILLFDVQSSDELNDRVEQYRLEENGLSHFLWNVEDIELVYVKGDENEKGNF